MFEIAEREAIYLWYYFVIQFEQIFGYWALGIAAGSVVSVFAKRRIHSLFAAIKDARLGALGVVPASLLGIASPLCMYGAIPIAAAFSQKGMRDDWLAAFMMSSVLLNPQLLMYSAALGSTAIVVRLVSCCVCGAAAGLCVNVFCRGKSFFNFTGFGEDDCKNRDTAANPFLRLFRNICRNIKATGPWFLLGVALSAVFTRYVDAEAVSGLFGARRSFGVFVAATVGVPLYVCGGGTIPLLRQWLESGMSMGAAAAFMITGPATKITNLGALKIVLGARAFAAYLLFVASFATLTGLVTNLFL